MTFSQFSEAGMNGIVTIPRISSFILVLLVTATNAIPFKNFGKEFPTLASSYNALTPAAKMVAESEILNMGQFDANRTVLSATGKYYIVEDATNDTATNTTTARKRRKFSGTPPTAYTSQGLPVHHSLPGARNVIFLNFLGGVIANTQWNLANRILSYTAKPFNIDSNPNAFSATEKSTISYIWNRVAEDYAPWNVDVTTEPPAVFGPTTGTIMITSNIDANGIPMPTWTAGGISYVNVWGLNNYAILYSPAFVYANNLGPNREDYIAEAAAHEMGHNLGLSHDGVLSPAAAYYSGTGTGVTSWGAIMGAPYNRAVSKFSNGDYPRANNKEDDIAIITAKLGLRADLVGNTPATATAITPAIDGAITATGIIEQSTDIDVFSFVTGPGLVSITVVPFNSPVHTNGNNLDVGLQLMSSTGLVYVSSQPVTTSSASVRYTFTTGGTYYIGIFATGNSATGYSAYGSVGQYSLSGSVVYVPTTANKATTIARTTKLGVPITTVRTTVPQVTTGKRIVQAAGAVPVTQPEPAQPSPDTTQTVHEAVAGLEITDPITSGDVARRAVVGRAQPHHKVFASAAVGTVLYASGLSGSTADSAGWVLSSDTWTWGAGFLKNLPDLRADSYESNASSRLKPAISPTFSTLGYSSVSLSFQRLLTLRPGDVAGIEACVALPSGLFAADKCVEVWSNSGRAVLDRAWKLVAYPLPPAACNAAAVQIRVGFGPLATLPDPESLGSTGIGHFNWNLRSLAVLGLQTV